MLYAPFLGIFLQLWVILLLSFVAGLDRIIMGIDWAKLSSKFHFGFISLSSYA